jgi:hypothetical protein
MPCIVMEDEIKDLIPVLKKTTGWKKFRNSLIWCGDISLHLELNRAGRRYLVQDGSSISKGVVLSRVNDDINSVFICWRIQDCATEAPSKCRVVVLLLIMPGRRVQGIVSGDKREQGSPITAKETRRRLE